VVNSVSVKHTACNFRVNEYGEIFLCNIHNHLCYMALTTQKAIRKLNDVEVSSYWLFQGYMSVYACKD
jgi:hypothetical protein